MRSPDAKPEAEVEATGLEEAASSIPADGEEAGVVMAEQPPSSSRPASGGDAGTAALHGDGGGAGEAPSAASPQEPGQRPGSGSNSGDPVGVRTASSGLESVVAAVGVGGADGAEGGTGGPGGRPPTTPPLAAPTFEPQFIVDNDVIGHVPSYAMPNISSMLPTYMNSEQVSHSPG